MATHGPARGMNSLAAFLTQPVFLLAFTIALFLLGVALQRRTGSSLANPTLVAVVLLGLLLHVTGIPYARYFAGTQLLHFLLGPGTVALAIPLVQSLEHLRRSLLPAALALLAGSVTGACSAYLLVRMCGGDRLLALTMMPKSLTTPIALDVSQTIGGIPSLTVVFGISAGILTAVMLPALLRWLRVSDAAAAGLAAGTAGSGIATSRVIAMGPVPAAFAGVAVGLNGLLTATIAPGLARLLSHW